MILAIVALGISGIIVAGAGVWSGQLWIAAFAVPFFLAGFALAYAHLAISDSDRKTPPRDEVKE